MENRIFRSRQDCMIGGVCGGLGKYLNIDSTFVRLFFILLALGNGIGILLYFLLWFIVPLEGQTRSENLGENVRQGSQEIADRAREMGDDLRGGVRPSKKGCLLRGYFMAVHICILHNYALLCIINEYFMSRHESRQIFC